MEIRKSNAEVGHFSRLWSSSSSGNDAPGAAAELVIVLIRNFLQVRGLENFAENL